MLPRLLALLLLRQVPGTFAYLAPAQQRVIGPLQQQLSMQKSLRSFFAAESSPKRQRKGTEEEPDAGVCSGVRCIAMVGLGEEK